LLLALSFEIILAIILIKSKLQNKILKNVSKKMNVEFSGQITQYNFLVF